jgi:DNA polymerase-3 subunit delta'
MSFSAINGNENLINRLKQMICADKLFHGYIFEGSTADTEALSEAFISAALCERHDGDACGVCTSCRKIADGNSEDVISVGTAGKSVKDRDIEEMISRTFRKSYTGRRLFMTVRNADSMTLRAQNRLLKTLEEPAAGVTIILLAENSESLVETIRSRCQLIKMFSDGIGESKETDEEFRQKSVSLAAAVLFGKPAYSMWKEIDEVTVSRQTAGDFLSTAETLYRDVLMSYYDSTGKMRINGDCSDTIEKCRRSFSAEQIMTAIESTELAVKDLARNVSAGHAVKYMIFDIQEKLNGNSNRSQI